MKKNIPITFPSLALAQLPRQSQLLENRLNLIFGTNQWMIEGFIIEGTLFHKRLAFDYSHGMCLNFDNELWTRDAKDQALAVHLPYFTGSEIGYRVNDWLNGRAEPQRHRFELYYDGENQTSETRIAAYNTFALGLLAYLN